MQRDIRLTLGVAYLFGLSFTTLARPQLASAAVRACKPLVVSAAYEAADEISAKRNALEDWMAQSRRYGQSHLSFRIAAHALLRCIAGPQGRFVCRSCGAPCVIRQVPPPGWTVYRGAWKNLCLPFIEELPSLRASGEVKGK